MTCDKCGKEVDPKDDVVNLDFILRGDLSLIGAQSRHIRAQYDEDRVEVCEGSPSRAQYIFEVRADQRPEYGYDSTLVKIYQDAWVKLQASF